MKKITLVGALCALLLATSCTSSQQFYGSMTGASLGGMFGSAIGGIASGPRGSDVGTLAGMLIGGAIGAAATAPKDTKTDEYTTSDYYNRYDENDYVQNGSYSPYAGIEIDDIRFFDLNNNDVIDAGEHSRIAFIVRNVSNDFIYDIAPVITVTGTKQIRLSPTAIISSLGPGKAVRYTAEVVASNKLKTGTAGFSIGLSDGNRLYTLYSFQIRTRGR